MARRLGALEAPRSLAELRLTEAEYHWLLQWTRDLPVQVARHWIADRTTRPATGDITRQQALGLLLFLLTAEVARREAAEGFVWSVVSKKFDLARPALFTQGQPNYHFKSAFEAVARRFQLRNVFGLEGTQNWYVSTYLQFGFTSRGIDHLPYRLSGYPLTESMEQLLGSGPNGAATFQQLWHDLRSYRRGNITEERMRLRLRASPWVLPSWEDNVVRLARERPELEASAGTDQDELEIPFIGQANVRWSPGDRPIASLPLQNLALLLSTGTYDVYVGRQHVRRIVCGEEGDVLGDEPVQVDLRAPSVTATIRQDDGSTALSQQIALWPEEEDVAAFDLTTGRRVDPWREPMTSDHSYGLILADDLELSAQAPSTGLAPGYRAYRVEAGWSTLEARLEGALLWESFLEGGSPPTLPDWIRSVDAQVVSEDGDLAIGKPIRLRIFNLGADLQFVRVAARPIDFEQVERTAVTHPIVVEPEHLGTELRVLVGVRSEGDIRVRRLSMELDLQGALLLTEDGWRAIGEDSVIAASSIETGRLRLLWPEDFKRRIMRYSVMEGPTLVRPAWSGSSVLRGLAGFGAELAVRERFNADDPRPRLVVARAVVSQGVCAGAAIRSEALELRLEYPIEPAPEHVAVLVRHDGVLEQHRCGEGLGPGEDWSVWRIVSDDLDEEEFQAVAIAYEGRRVGAFFFSAPQRLADDLAPGGPGDGAIRAAALLRWLHAPVLGSPWRDACQRLVDSAPCDVLAAWLTDAGLPLGFQHEDLSDAWLSALRAFYLRANFNLTRAAFGELWTRLGAYDPRASRLSPMDILDELTPDLFLVGLKWTIQEALGTKDDIGSFLFPEGLASAEGAALVEAAELLQVDENFVKRGIGDQVMAWLTKREELDEPHWRNLEICYSLSPVRRYIAARVLREVL